MIFDDDEAFDEDRDQLLSSMKDGGVGCIVNVCASAGGFGGTLELIKAYPFVKRILLCMAQWGFIPTMQEL